MPERSDAVADPLGRRRAAPVAPRADRPPATLPAAGVPREGRLLRSLQLGMEWFPERPSGVNRYYYDLVRHLPPAGVDVRGLVAGPPESASASDGRVRGVVSPTAPVVERWWRLRSQAVREFAASSVDVVASHFALYAFPVLDLLRDRPMVVHFHGPWALEGRREGAGRASVAAKRLLERSVYRRACLLVALSHAFARVLEQTYGVSASRIRVIPGGVDVVRFAGGRSRAAARAALGWDPDRPVILAVRRLVRRTGLEDLVAAAGMVRRRIPDVLFVIAGTGPLASELKARIDAAGLRSHVRLLGHLPDAELPLAYLAAQLTVVPTVALEGFGLIVAESLSAGTPVLVRPVGGLPEAVAGLSRALVLADLSTATLAQGMIDALEGRLELPGGEACRAFARAHYDWPIVARRIAAVYAEAMR